MLKVIDYGLGNVAAFLNLYGSLNIPAEAARSSSDLRDATAIVLPGVGAFDRAMELLQQSELFGTLRTLVEVNKTPVLGVCVGMQLMADSSEEGRLPGLRWIPGKVRQLPASTEAVVPHMGWNNASAVKDSRLLDGLADRSEFYFLHSYYVDCATKSDVLAEADYGGRFCCAFERDNLFGVQFHPEKSHDAGIGLLKNFARISHA